MNNIPEIPSFLSNTEFGHIIENELYFKNSILSEIEDFKNNFDISLNSIYTLSLFRDLLRIYPNEADKEEDLRVKLSSTLEALRNPGTFSSIVNIFLGLS